MDNKDPSKFAILFYMQLMKQLNVKTTFIYNQLFQFGQFDSSLKTPIRAVFLTLKPQIIRIMIILCCFKV